MRTGITRPEKTSDIGLDEKALHIHPHNTNMKKPLLAYSRRYPLIYRQIDADLETD